MKTTDIGGPAWKAVVSRTTYDLADDKNQIIEHISIDKGVGAATLYKKLLPTVSEIRTVLHYKEEPEKKGIRNPKITEKKYVE